MMSQENLAKHSQLIDQDRLEYIDGQQQLFDEARAVLFEHYPNEYVAFEDGQVLDHDTDEARLSERVYTKYGYRDLIMQQVTATKPVYYIGGFRRIQESSL